MKTISISMFVCCFLFLSLSSLHAQLNEAFSDGNISSDPVWTGDTSFWKVEKGILNSKAPVQKKGKVSLVTPLENLSKEAEWRFYINPAFATSSTNFTEVYLISETSDLSVSDAVFVRIGDTRDNVSLFIRKNKKLQKRISGADKKLSSTKNNPLKVKVSRAAGKWSLWTAYGSEEIYQPEGEAVDSDSLNGAWTGISLSYTNTNGTKLSFDDYVIAPFYRDTLAPVIKEVKVVSDSSLLLVFSEALDQKFVTGTESYFIPGIGYPDSVFFNVNTVQLFFPEKFIRESEYNLTVAGIKDVEGNVLHGNFSFRWAPKVVEKNDLLITELMVDPSPSVELPEVEYIEVYNNTSAALDLDNFVLSTSKTKVIIPSCRIAARDYLIFCPAKDSALFGKVTNKVCPIKTFPALVNTGERLSLSDPYGKVIYEVGYSDEWYADNQKREGGWSLEMIDPALPCLGEENWTASRSKTGGTPGRQNSVYGHREDHTSPEVIRVGVPDSITVELGFSEPFELNGSSKEDFRLSGQRKVVSVQVNSSGNTIILQLDKPLVRNQIEELSLPLLLSDCAGNHPIQTQLRLSLPEPPAKGDLIINEILFDAKTGGSDFVEIFNRSAKILELKGLKFVKEDPITGAGKSSIVISTESHLLFSGEYRVVARTRKGISEFYHIPSWWNIIENQSFPNLNQEEGMAIFLNQDNAVVDAFHYSSSMHFQLLNSVKGVSLERISTGKSSEDRNNWHSAGSGCGYGTPGYLNSQSEVATGELISVAPEIFSPDNDGYNDLLTIGVKSEASGKMGTVEIFSSSGRLIRKLADNELMGRSEMYFWDGLDTDGSVGAPGVYLIHYQFFTLEGEVKNGIKTCVLAQKQ